MTAEQALRLLQIHQKEARLLGEPPHLKRRRAESTEAWSLRATAMYELRLERDREAYRLGEESRRNAAAPRSPFEPPPAVLPLLDMVTGWSRAT